MAKPKISPQEIENVKTAINHFINISKQPIITFNFTEIYTSLALGDQNIDRFRSLIIPALRNSGMDITLFGSNITVKIKERMEQTQVTSQNSNLTKLSHQYIAPSNYRDILFSVIMGDNTLFLGPPGCGKSITAEHIGNEIGREVFNRDDFQVTRASLGGAMTSADLIGEMLLLDSPKGTGVVTQYIYGMLTEAAEKGYMLICDEIDRMSPEANLAFQRITETDGQIIIKTERGKVEIKRHPHFRLLFTANTHLTGDASGMYGSAQVQDYSFRDRISTTFEFDYMPFTEKQMLLNDYKLPHIVCNMLYGKDGETGMGLVNILRNACKNGTIQAHLSMRTIVEFAKHYRAFQGSNKLHCFSWHKAMHYCLVSKFPPQYHKQVLETFQTVCGPELVPTNNVEEIKKHSQYLKDKGFFPSSDCYLAPELSSFNV